MARKRFNWPNPWLTLGEATMLAAEAQSVIALRLARLAGGGKRGRAEAARMILEKGTAFLAAQAAAAAALPIGGAALTVGTVITTYRRSVRANHRRLSRGGRR
jgi:hypothetical protein